MRTSSLFLQIIVHSSHYTYAFYIRSIGIAVTYGELPLRGIADFPQFTVRILGKLLGCSTSVLRGLLYHSGLHFVETGEFIRHIIFIIPSRDGNTLLQEFSLPR